MSGARANDAGAPVVVTVPEGEGDGAVADALRRVRELGARGCPAAWECTGDLVATAWALAYGAQLVRARDITRSERLARTFAAIAGAGAA